MRSIEDYITLLLKDPFNKLIQGLDEYDNQLSKYKAERPTKLQDFKSHIEKLKRFQNGINSQQYNLSTDVIYAKIVDDMQQEKDDILQEVESKLEALDNKVEALKLSIEESNRIHNEFR